MERIDGIDTVETQSTRTDYLTRIAASQLLEQQQAEWDAAGNIVRGQE